MADAIRVLGFAGSLRQGSYNRALLRAAQAHEKFDVAGNLTDEPTQRFLEKYLIALAAWTARLLS